MRQPKLADLLLLNKQQNLFESFQVYYQSHSDVAVVIFGVGDMGMFAKKALEQNGITIEAFCDNNENKQGTWVKGKKVLSPKELLQYQENIAIVNIDSFHQEKKEQLLTLGISENLIWSFDIVNPLQKDLTRSYILNHLQAFEYSYSCLADVQSKKVFCGYLNGVLTGDLSFYKQIMISGEYFPEGLIPQRDDHVFVDVGALDGDTAVNFIRYFEGKYEKIYAFEPIATSAAMLQARNLERLELHAIAASEKKGSVAFYCNDYGEMTVATTVQGKGAKDGVMQFNTDTIDNVLSGRKATFIKMDIEGSELAALRGAQTTISKYKPFLAICVYHKRADLIEILPYLKALVPEYRMFLRHHSNTPTDLVLYCSTCMD